MIRPAAPADFDAVLSLNLESEHFLSPLDRARLDALHRVSARHQVAEADGRIAAFLLAFREGVDYDSVNYRWFDTRYSRFIYIDRVVVSSTAHGQGLASALYRDVFDFARSHEVENVMCEYDIEPPNHASRRLHDKFGFAEVGRQWVAGGSKCVSLQCAPVSR